MTLLSTPPFSLPQLFSAVDTAISSNADIADAVLAVAIPTYSIPAETETKPPFHGAATPSDLDKARSTLRQLYRDWSLEGLPERTASFAPIISALNKYTSHLSPPQRSHLQVLVPGAGLGRLVFEINREGYAVEGNEISYHQLFVSNWILNHVSSPQSHTLYPWALNFSNHTHRAHQLQKILIPDVHPGTALHEASEALGAEIHAFERMSMSSGDFCVVYREDRENRARFDAVTTCFFIDTAPNLLAYVETVRFCLRDGGVWINLGPLLWHFESGGPTTDNREKEHESSGGDSSSKGGRSQKSGNAGIAEAGSFELADEEVIALLQVSGFEIVEHRSCVGEAGYIQDPNSMLQNIYRPSFWVARKKEVK